jgi:hypothetical protein
LLRLEAVLPAKLFGSEVVGLHWLALCPSMRHRLHQMPTPGYHNVTLKTPKFLKLC